MYILVTERKNSSTARSALRDNWPRMTNVSTFRNTSALSSLAWTSERTSVLVSRKHTHKACACRRKASNRRESFQICRKVMSCSRSNIWLLVRKYENYIQYLLYRAYKIESKQCNYAHLKRMRQQLRLKSVLGKRQERRKERKESLVTCRTAIATVKPATGIKLASIHSSPARRHPFSKIMADLSPAYGA